MNTDDRNQNSEELTEAITIDTGTRPHIEIENRSQELHRELSLREITTIIFQNWPLFFLLLILTTSLGLSFYTWKNPYVAKASIIVNDNQNSQLQSFSQSLAGGTKTNEAKKNNSTVQKQLEFFKTTDFFQKILTTSNSSIFITQLSLVEKKGERLFFNEILGKKLNHTEDEKLQIYQKLDQIISFKVKNDYEIEISVADDKKELSLYLANLTAVTALEAIKTKESAEVQVMSDFLLKEKSAVDQELLELNKKMAAFNDKPENLISLSSRDKVGEYLSELMVRKNETLMKLTENNKIIQTLSEGSGQRRESLLYGNNGRVQSLKLENELLRSKLGQIQSAIDRVSNDAKGMPYAAQMYEELKKRSDQQLVRFKELSESLTKVEALKLAAINKYEIFEKSRIDKVLPAVSLMVVLFLSVLLSQVIGSLIIYLRAIWDSNMITAESTRNVVVVDSHSLDPRVIIENSKIRFRLRHSSMTEEDREQGQTKKLGFNFKSKN